MKIVAKTTGGFLLQATENEIRDLQRSLGNKSPDPKIDDVIPVLDYTAQVSLLKTLSDSSDMKYLVSTYTDLGKVINKFKDASEKLK